MSIQIMETAKGLVTVKLTGKLTPAEQQEYQRRLVESIGHEGHTDVLVLAQDFQGWEKGDWSDVSFQAQYDQHVGKMAIVGDKKWTDLAILFTGKGLRRVQIEMFSNPEEARAWIAAEP